MTELAFAISSGPAFHHTVGTITRDIERTRRDLDYLDMNLLAGIAMSDSRVRPAPRKQQRRVKHARRALVTIFPAKA